MISNILELLMSLFDSVICIYFIMKYNGSSLKKGKHAIAFTIVYFLFTILGDRYFPGFSILTTVGLLVISLVYALSVCNKHYVRAIMSACIYKIVFILLSSLTYTVLSLIFNDFGSLLQGADSIGRYIYMLIHKTALFAVLLFILHITEKNSLLEKESAIYSLTISFITIIGLGTTMTLSLVSSSEYLKYSILILTATFVLVNLIVYLLIYQLQKLQKNKYELSLLQEKLHFEEERHNDATAIWDNIRKVQHDIKQHLTIIAGQLEDNKTEECKQYVGKLLPNVERMGKLIKSNNAILDYLINSKLCSLKDTQILISGSVSDLSDIKDVDLACLMGNILDNAIEAIEECTDKRIELLFAMQNSNRVIICKNTIAKSVLSNNTEMYSTKTNGNHHGFGHVIISKIITDYNGIVDYFEEDDMFGVQLIIPLPDSNI